MAFDISEIKNLPTQEKLRIIGELWESIDENELTGSGKEEPPEIINMLEERIAKYEKGEAILYSVEEVRSMLQKKLEEIRNDKLQQPKR